MDIQAALKELAQQIKEEVQRSIIAHGYNIRAKKNTLVGSRLYESVDVQVENENTLVFEIAEHFKWVVLGWQRTGKSNKTGLKEALRQWINDKNIRIGKLSKAQILYWVYKHMIIDKRPIEARPFLHLKHTDVDASGELNDNIDARYLMPFLDKYFENWADRIFEQLMDDIKYFNK